MKATVIQVLLTMVVVVGTIIFPVIAQEQWRKTSSTSRCLAMVMSDDEGQHFTQFEQNSYTTQPYTKSKRRRMQTLTSTTRTITHPTGFQAHSVNDLREWKALYRKGTRSFKLDPHYYSRSSSTNSSSLSDSLQLSSPPLLLLSHNEPLNVDHKRWPWFPRGAGTTHYDELMDVLDELNPERPNSLGQLAHRDHAKVRVQLCFKSVPDPCARGAHGRRNHTALAWLAVMDEFFTQANLRAERGTLCDVEFILDGGGKPFDCLRWCWLPWSSVWISGDNKSPPDALTMDDAGRNRYAVLNNPNIFTEWQHLQSMNYGKFSKRQYPYQVWEPSEQTEFQKYVRFFQSGPPHEPGFDFVSNMDPVQTASWAQSGGVKSQMFVQGRSVGCPIGVHVFHASGNIMVGFTNDGQPTIATSNTVEGSMIFLHPPTGLPWSRMTGSSDGIKVTVFNAEGAYAVLLDSPKTLSIPLHQGMIGSSGNHLLSLRPLTYYYQPKSWFLIKRPRRVRGDGYLAVMFGDEECVGGVMVIRTSTWNATITATATTRRRVCVVMNRGPLSPHPEADVVEIGNDETDPVLVVVADEDKTVFVALVKFRRFSTAMTVVQAKQLTFGTHPRLTRVTYDNDDVSSSSGVGKSVVTLTLTDSFCFNCEENNKRSLPRLCDSKPVSTPQIMTYTIGTSKQWIRRVIFSNRTLSACDTDLLHGNFDVGMCPSVASTAGQLVMIHQAPSGSATSHVERKCGAPAWRDGLIRTVLPFQVKQSVWWKAMWNNDGNGDEDDDDVRVMNVG